MSSVLFLSFVVLCLWRSGEVREAFVWNYHCLYLLLVLSSLSSLFVTPVSVIRSGKKQKNFFFFFLNSIKIFQTFILKQNIHFPLNRCIIYMRTI